VTIEDAEDRGQADVYLYPMVDEDSLRQELAEALEQADFRTVGKVSAKLVAYQANREKMEASAKQEALASVTEKVKAAIEKAIRPIVDSEAMADADGVWFAWDFGEQLSAVTVIKSDPKKARQASHSRAGGKRFQVSTEELLSRYGGEPMPNSSLTYDEAYAEAKGDGNKRYQVRQQLLKHHGLLR